MNAQTDKHNQLTLELLQAIEEKDDISQRHLAQRLGVALGLANASLKRCVKKGWIKISSAPANRYLYYLTPSGFAEKARLTGEFLSTSLTLFRQAGDSYKQLLLTLSSNQSRVLFAGLSDLTEIAYLKSLECSVQAVAVYQPDSSLDTFFDLPICDQIQALEFDYVLMTSLEQTAELSAWLLSELDQERILTPSFLVDMQYRASHIASLQIEENHYE